MIHTQTTSPNRITLHAGKKWARPAGIESLAPAFEKSATDLKLKQQLLKCKNTIQIVTLNVRTLNRIGKLSGLTASAIDPYIDIICIQYYLHREHLKYHDTGNGWTFVSASAWKISVNVVIGGICLWDHGP